MTTSRSVVLLAFLWLALVACVSKPYVLPTADGGPEPSPPSLQGRIAKVEPGEIVVTRDRWSSNTGSDTVVRLTPATEIFTVYGGNVPESKLVTGLKVRVWCARPTKLNPGEVLTAATVMIASKEPHDDWP